LEVTPSRFRIVGKPVAEKNDASVWQTAYLNNEFLGAGNW
jgi:hypothetical protein